MKSINWEKIGKMVKSRKATKISAKTCVAGGYEISTNCETWVYAESDKQAGMYFNGAKTTDDAELFPDFDNPEAEFITILSPEQIAELAKFVDFACTVELRPVLNSIYLDALNNKLRVVATDGHKLKYKVFQDVECCTEINPECRLNDNPDVEYPNYILVSSLFVKAIAEIGKAGHSVKLSTGIGNTLEAAFIQAKSDSGYICSYCIEGSYPNFIRVFPASDNFTTAFTIENADQVAKDIKQFNTGLKRDEKFTQVAIHADLSCSWNNKYSDANNSWKSLGCFVESEIYWEDFVLLMPVTMSKVESAKPGSIICLDADYLATCAKQFENPVLHVQDAASATVICNLDK